MRFCYFSSSQAQWLAQQPIPLPAAEGVGGFTWAQITRSELAAQPEALQELAQQHGQQRVLPLHMSDLLNAQHPSRYDYSSHYDVLIFRRLLPAGAFSEHTHTLETTPVAFVLFDNLLLTVLDETQVWDEAFVARFMQEGRLPHSPADLMLRIINALVDDFLNQRKTLSARLQHWQAQLLHPHASFKQWQALLAERAYFNDLESVCEEQSDAMQEWLDSVQEQGEEAALLHSLQRDMLLARSRDIMDHIQRVSQHVSKLETSMENAVQIHFSAQANRANATMQVLTVIAAIFLPLNFVTGFFGMNFDSLPLIHHQQGLWAAILAMLLAAGLMGWFFWRKRYWAQGE